MKLTAASTLPVLALLPATSLANLLDKRAPLECKTVYGTRAAKFKTATVTIKAARIVEATVNVKYTVTITPTVTRQNTEIVTVTDHITSTKTGTTRTTSVTGTSTLTVAASAGFTPAAAAVAKNNSKRAALAAPYHNVKRAPEPAAAKKVAKKVAVAVTCTKRLKADKTTTVKSTIKPYITRVGQAKTVTTGLPATKRVQHVVSTRTIYPTLTVEVPRATHLAACDSSNLLSWTYGPGSTHANGTQHHNSTTSAHVGISSVLLVAGTVPKTYDVSTAAECCVKCQTTNGCLGSQWRSGVCNLHVRVSGSNTCSALTSVFSFGTFYASSKNTLNIGEGMVLSNGRCGSTWKYGGLTGS